MMQNSENLQGSVNHYSDEKRDIRSRKAIIKPGPLAYKTAELATFSDPTNQEIKAKSLVLKTFRRKPSAPGWDFKKPEAAWRCEGEEEIAKLKALLDGVISETGTYRKVDPESAAEAIISLLESGKLEERHARDIATALSQSSEAIAALSSTGAGQVFTQAVQSRQRQATLAILDKAVKDPLSNEATLQEIVDNDWWLFGGRFIGKSERRSLTVLDQLDIPLICYDGSLHIAELKKANIPNIVTPYRNHFIVGPDVNEAVGQAENYLRELEEERANIKLKLGIECRRISATVVIGHISHASHSAQLYETLRTYNSHLSRVEVITYDQLIANTANALKFGKQK